MVKEAGLDDIIVTPEFVKQWDNTWDVIVNKQHWNKPFDYYLNTDIYSDGLPQLQEVNVTEINAFKFAGGWFTLISKSLLDKTGIPESFGHYGLEDTYIMACAYTLKQKGHSISQFVLENLIIGENHLYRTNNTIKNYISSKDRKKEFLKIAEANFEKELNIFNKQ
jgi:hypothetical protein